MRRKLAGVGVSSAGRVLAFIIVALLLIPGGAYGQGGGMTVTVGPANADIVGTDDAALQKAVDRVAAAGGGTVVIKAEPTC